MLCERQPSKVVRPRAPRFCRLCGGMASVSRSMSVRAATRPFLASVGTGARLTQHLPRLGARGALSPQGDRTRQMNRRPATRLPRLRWRQHPPESTGHAWQSYSQPLPPLRSGRSIRRHGSVAPADRSACRPAPPSDTTGAPETRLRPLQHHPQNVGQRLNVTLAPFVRSQWGTFFTVRRIDCRITTGPVPACRPGYLADDDRF